MTKTYPQFLYPIAVSLQWNKKITLEALAESYSLFRSDEKVVTHLKEERTSLPSSTLSVLTSLQNKHLNLPYTIGSKKPAEQVFLQDYLAALQNTWNLTLQEPGLSALIKAPVTFEPPTLSNGKPITGTEAVLLKIFATPKIHGLTSRKTQRKPVLHPYFTMRNNIKANRPVTEQEALQAAKPFVETSNLVETKKLGDTDTRNMWWFITTMLIANIIVFSALTQITHFLIAGVITLLSNLILFYISGLMGLILLGIGNLAFPKLPFFKINDDYDGTIYFYHVKLSPYGKEILTQLEAWENYKKLNPEAAYSYQQDKEKEEQEQSEIFSSLFRKSRSRNSI